MSFSVDINCDMGEGMTNESLIMPFISSANIACGYHAGDAATMQQTLELALQHQVAVGAHPSYPDKENFGRTAMHLSAAAICNMVKEQIGSLANIASKYNYQLHHVKPHGALYNMAMKDEVVAEAICKAVIETDKSLVIYAQSGSKLIAVAQSMHLKTANEVFADRTYQSDGSLTPRSQPNALIENEETLAKQVLEMVTQHIVTAISGKIIPVKTDTICIHGDGGHTVEFARCIYELLYLNDVSIKSIG